MMSYLKAGIKDGVLGAYRLTLSRPNFDIRPTRCYALALGQIAVIADTPNVVIRFEHEGETFFFRECRVHDEKDQYLKELLDDFCVYVAEARYTELLQTYFRQTILSNRNALNRFFRMGDGTSPASRVTRFRLSGDPAILGFPADVPQEVRLHLLRLVQFAWGGLAEYQYNSYVKVGELQNYNACRTLASKALADCAGCGDLVPSCEFAKVSFDGRERIGVVMACAKGVSPEDAGLDGPIGVAPVLQRNLTTLNVLDVICYQKDHRPGNYFVSIDDERRAYAVSAFDNDCPSTFMPVANIGMRAYRANSPIALKSGVFNRPFLDKGLAERLSDLCEDSVRDAVAPYLSRFQQRAVIQRLRKMNKAIASSSSQGTLALLETDQWNERTITEEIQGNFGLTYTRLFSERYGRKLEVQDLYRNSSPI